MFPRDRKMTRSHIASTSCMLWEVYTMVTPRSRWISPSAVRTLSAMSGSRLAVGSSRKRASGSLRNALHRFSRVIWPDDSAPVTCVSVCGISKSSSSSVVRRLAFLTPYRRENTVRFSSTVRFEGRDM